MKRRVMTWLLMMVMMVSLIPSVSLAVEPFELVSVTATGDYTVELRFNAEVADATVDIINAGNATAGTSNKIKAGIVWVLDGVDMSTGPHIDNFTVGTRIYGTVAFGKTKDTLVWTITSTDGTKVSDLAGKQNNGYTRKFFLFDDGNGGVGTPGYIAGVLSADGRNLTTPTPRAGQQNEYLIADIAPRPGFVLESANVLNDYQIKLKFSETLADATVANYNAARGYLGGLLLVSNEKNATSGYYDRQNEFTIAGTMAFGETKDTLIWTITEQNNNNAISNVLNTWKKDGFSVKFGFKDNDCGNFGEGHIGAILSASGKALTIPADHVRPGAGQYEYTFIEVTPYVNPNFELLSAKAISDYKIELKFSQELADATVTNYNAAHGYFGGLLLVSNEKNPTSNYYDRQNEFTIAGTMAFGETKDTLIWTVTNQTAGNSISNALNTWKKDGFSVKFGFKDNDCGNFGEGHIGAILSKDGKALSIPADHVRPGAGQYEYTFIEVTPYVNSTFELLSAKAISEYKIELKFSQELADATITNYNAARGYLGGLLLVSNEKNATSGYYDRQNEFTIAGTMAFGETKDTLIWTVTSQTAGNAISNVLKTWKKDGFSVKFGFKDNDCGNFGEGFIGAILSKDGKPLSIPADHVRHGAGQYEYTFIEVTPYENPLLEVESIKQISARQIELKFSENLNTTPVNGKPWVVDTINKGSAVKVGIAWVKNDYAITLPGFDSIVTGIVDGTVAMGPTNDTLIWTAPENAQSITAMFTEQKEGYSLKFYFRDMSCYWISAFHTISGIQNANGTKALYTPVSRGDGGYEYLFESITPFENPYVELLSVTQTGDHQLELKFSEALKTDDINGTPWIVDTINKGATVKIGMAWIKDDYEQTLPGFDSIATDILEGTVAMGSANDTLVWTMKDTTKALDDLMNEKKEGYSLKFYLRDMSCYWISAFHTISAIQNADGTKALYTPVSRGDGGYEYLFADISLAGELTVTSATIVSGNQIILTFSAPVEFKYKPFLGLRIMDENMNMVFDNGAPLQIYEGNWEYTDDTHTSIMWTSKDWILEDYINLSGKFEKYNAPGRKTYFCIEEMQDAAGQEIDTKGNGFIDNIVRADGKMLVASKKATGENYDGLYLAITEDYREPEFYLKSVTLINAKQLALEFNKPVQLDKILPYIGIRYVDKTLKLQFEGKTPLQYQGTWAYGNKEKTVLIITESFGGNFESVVKKSGGFSKYADYEVMFCFEEIPADREKDMEDGTIHNIFTDANTRLYANKVAGGPGWDGVYMPITIDYAYKIPGTPESSAIKTEVSYKKPEANKNESDKDDSANKGEAIEVMAGSASDKLLMAIHQNMTNKMPWIVLGFSLVVMVGVLTVLILVIAKKKSKE